MEVQTLAAQIAPMLGVVILNARRRVLAAAGMGRACASIQVPGRASRSLTLVSEEETRTFRPTSELRNDSGARTPVKSNNTLMPPSLMRTLRLKVRSEAYPWLNAAAGEVNVVFNYCNETSYKASTRTDLKRKWFTGFDLCRLTAGATEYFEKIGADTIQSVCVHYAQKRQSAKKLKLKWSQRARENF
jgi:hypothetical protein